MKIFKTIKKRALNFDRLSDFNPFSLDKSNRRYSRQFWSETLTWATASGTAVANTGTETILFPNVTIPANYLQDGRVLRLRAFGVYGTTATPSCVISVRWGGVAGTILGKTGLNVLTSAVGGGASMTANWNAEIYIQTRSNGSSGTLMTNGEVNWSTSTLATAGTVTQYGMPTVLVSGATGAPGTAAAVSTVDLTADTALSLTALWSATNAANSIQGLNYTIEALN